MTHFLASHEKMCQISYKFSLFWMATMVAKEMSQTLGTYECLDDIWVRMMIFAFH
jgi:hypothetical protein